jgi:hypothetical protein
VLSAPVIREPITGGSGQISGSFTTRAAHDLAVMLRAGALPAPKVSGEPSGRPGQRCHQMGLTERSTCPGFRLRSSLRRLGIGGGLPWR